MCTKQRAQLEAPAKSTRFAASWSIILSLLDALSQVMASIFKLYWCQYVCLFFRVHLLTNTKIFQNFFKCRCEVGPCIRTHPLYNIKQHGLRSPFHLHVHNYGNECLAIGGSPHICCKVQGTIIYLCLGFSMDWVHGEGRYWTTLILHGAGLLGYQLAQVRQHTPSLCM
jgi:hypothetical protein